MVVLIFGIFLFTIQLISGNKFIDNFCEKNVYQENLIVCKDFSLPNEEYDSKGDVPADILSRERIIVERADIETMDLNFLDRFPRASKLTLKYSNLKLKSPQKTHSLNHLIFFQTKVFGNQNITTLTSFPDLLSFQWIASKPSGWMEFTKIDKYFFSGNPKLEKISISFSSMDTHLTENILSDGCFDAQIRLERLVYTFGKQDHISKNLLKYNKKLTFLEIYSNGINFIEKDAFPTSLEFLDLSRNNLKDISDVFNGLIHLRTLILFNNNIQEVNANTFKNLESLESLDLSKNPIKTMKAVYLKNLHNLRFFEIDEEDKKPE